MMKKKLLVLALCCLMWLGLASPALAAVEGQEIAVTEKIFAPNFAYAPIKSGDIIGKIVYYKEGQPVGESPLAAGESIEALPVEKPKTLWEKIRTAIR